VTCFQGGIPVYPGQDEIPRFARNDTRPGLGMTRRPGLGMTQRPGLGMTRRPRLGMTQRPGLGMTRRVVNNDVGQHTTDAYAGETPAMQNHEPRPRRTQAPGRAACVRMV